MQTRVCRIVMLPPQRPALPWETWASPELASQLDSKFLPASSSTVGSVWFAADNVVRLPGYSWHSSSARHFPTKTRHTLQLYHRILHNSQCKNPCPGWKQAEPSERLCIAFFRGLTYNLMPQLTNLLPGFRSSFLRRQGFNTPFTRHSGGRARPPGCLRTPPSPILGIRRLHIAVPQTDEGSCSVTLSSSDLLPPQTGLPPNQWGAGPGIVRTPPTWGAIQKHPPAPSTPGCWYAPCVWSGKQGQHATATLTGQLTLLGRHQACTRILRPSGRLSPLALAGGWTQTPTWHSGVFLPQKALHPSGTSELSAPAPSAPIHQSNFLHHPLFRGSCLPLWDRGLIRQAWFRRGLQAARKLSNNSLNSLFLFQPHGSKGLVKNGRHRVGVKRVSNGCTSEVLCISGFFFAFWHLLQKCGCVPPGVPHQNLPFRRCQRSQHIISALYKKLLSINIWRVLELVILPSVTRHGVCAVQPCWARRRPTSRNWPGEGWKPQVSISLPGWPGNSLL